MDVFRRKLLGRRTCAREGPTSSRCRCRTRWIYALALYEDKGATPDDLRGAVTSLEEVKRTARRVFGPAHPLTKGIERYLKNSREALHAHEKQSGSA